MIVDTVSSGPPPNNFVPRANALPPKSTLPNLLSGIKLVSLSKNFIFVGAFC